MQAFIKSLFGTSTTPDPLHPLSLFHHCDTAVLNQMAQLSQFVKGSSDNDLDRRSKLIKDLKDSQHNLLIVLMHTVDMVIPEQKMARDFRVKYPDELPMDQFYGAIWFGAECLSAGSRIANHDYESIELKPYAVRLSRCIKRLRDTLRRSGGSSSTFKPSGMMRQVLKDFDKSWVDFEFRYVSAMCNVQTEMQLVHQQEVAVLFSEATHRALDLKYFNYDQIELMEPAIMFAIPRLSIISGLAIFPDGPINPQKPSRCIPACFRPYRQLLAKIKDILVTLSKEELIMLEQALCANDGLSFLSSNDSSVSLANKEIQQDAKSLLSCSTTSHLTFDPTEIETLRTNGEKESLDITHADDNGTENLKETVYEMSSQLSNSSSLDFLSRFTVDVPLQHTLDTLNSGFTSSNDRLHKLFLAVSEVADQLQTNFPRDYRAILKYVFQICTEDSSEDSSLEEAIDVTTKNKGNPLEESVFSSFEFDLSLSRSLQMSSTQQHTSHGSKVEWVSDKESQECHNCCERFSFFRRRHHCRACGQVVCGSCSPYSLPLSEGPHKAERVCATCYIAKLGIMASALSPGIAAIVL